MLGREIVRHADATWNAVGACHRTPREDLLQLDFGRPDEVIARIVEGAFTHIVHCAAIRDPDYCLAHPDETEATNVRGSITVATAAQALGATLCYISTDYVFDGTCPPYKEDDTPNPVNLYGRSKLAGERAAATVPNHMMVRIPALYTAALGDKANVLTGLVNRLERGETLQLDSETVRYYTRAEDVAAAVLLLLDIGHQGVIHVSADEATSKAAFARLAATHFGYPSDRVMDTEPPSTGDVRPHNSHLDTTLYRSLPTPSIRPSSKSIQELRAP